MRTIRLISQSDAAFNITVRSDDDSVLLPSVRKGNYELVVEAEGFLTERRTVAINNQTTFTVYLERDENTEPPDTQASLYAGETDLSETTLIIGTQTVTNPTFTLENNQIIIGGA